MSILQRLYNSYRGIKVSTRYFGNGAWRTDVIAKAFERPFYEELCRRVYPTEAEARAGHADIVARLRAVPDLRPEQVAEVLG